MSAPLILAPLNLLPLAVLERRYHETQSPETRTRYRLVFLSQQDGTPLAIAATVLRSHDTVSRVLHCSPARYGA